MNEHQDQQEFIVVILGGTGFRHFNTWSREKADSAKEAAEKVVARTANTACTVAVSSPVNEFSGTTVDLLNVEVFRVEAPPKPTFVATSLGA